MLHHYSEREAIHRDTLVGEAALSPLSLEPEIKEQISNMMLVMQLNRK